MAIFEAKMTSKGQVTVPVEIRNAFNIKPGDKLLFCTDERRTLRVIVKNRTLASMAGFLGTPPVNSALSIEDLDDALGEALGRDDKRIRDDWSGHEHTAPAPGKRRPAAE